MAWQTVHVPHLNTDDAHTMWKKKLFLFNQMSNFLWKKNLWEIYMDSSDRRIEHSISLRETRYGGGEVKGETGTIFSLWEFRLHFPWEYTMKKMPKSDIQM